MDANTKKRAYPRQQPVPYTQPNDMTDSAISIAQTITRGLIIGEGEKGGWLDSVTVSPNNPPDLTVLIEEGHSGFSGLGEHLPIPSQVQQDCAVDYLGISCVPLSGNLYISIFASFEWADSSLIPVPGYDDPFPRVQTESTVFRVYRGTSTSPPDNPGLGAILVAVIKMREGIDQILSSDISYGQPINQDRFIPVSQRMPVTGGVFTGDIYRMTTAGKRPYAYRNGGTFTWGNAYGVYDVVQGGSPIAWAEWMVGLKYSAAVITHGLGNVLLSSFVQQPTITESNYPNAYGHISTLIGGSIGGEAAMGNIFAIQPNPLNGTVLIIVVGTKTWVEWFRFADKIYPRVWKWVAFA